MNPVITCQNAKVLRANFEDMAGFKTESESSKIYCLLQDLQFPENRYNRCRKGMK